jgi:hypothetical protein
MSYILQLFLGLSEHVLDNEEPGHMTNLEKDADVGVIQSKD